MRRLFAFALAFTVASGADLNRTIGAILNRTPEAKGALWGIVAIDAGTGSVVFAYNADKFFVPASNTKLFTTALALEKLGPDHRFRTEVRSPALPDTNGRVKELRLIGGGDPNLSRRILPYSKENTGGDGIPALASLADAVVASGVREVEGDVIGDDTAFVYEPYPDGWSVDDPVWEYGAPVSALTLNDNAFEVQVAPGEIPGASASVTISPAVEQLTVHNRVTTSPDGPARLSFDRVPGSTELIITGSIPPGSAPDRSLLAVHDPALFAAGALRDALLLRGVRIRGGVRAEHRLTESEIFPGGGASLASHVSPPLIEALAVANKVSQNLHTELILLELARVRHGVGTRRKGLEEIREFLKTIGVEENQHYFRDASGLSRLTLVSPRAVATLLLYMHRSPNREAWVATLPIGGEDGTLENRFERSRIAAKIRAKTGSVSHVSTLAGYALRPDGSTWIFSIMANNYTSPTAPVRRVIDRIALTLLGNTRRSR